MAPLGRAGPTRSEATSKQDKIRLCSMEPNSVSFRPVLSSEGHELGGILVSNELKSIGGFYLGVDGLYAFNFKGWLKGFVE